MKKDNTLKIALTITGIVLLVVIGIFLFVWNMEKTIHNSKYKNIYCNGDCYYYDGKVILTEEEKNTITGKYKINNNILEINKDVSYLTSNVKQKKKSDCQSDFLFANKHLLISYRSSINKYFHPYRF